MIVYGTDPELYYYITPSLHGLRETPNALNEKLHAFPNMLSGLHEIMNSFH